MAGCFGAFSRISEEKFRFDKLAGFDNLNELKILLSQNDCKLL